MSRARSAREGICAVAGPHWQEFRASVGRHLPKTELLRRLVPVLLIGFVLHRLRRLCLPDCPRQARGARCGAATARADRRQRLAQSEGQDARLERNWQGALAGEPAQGRDRRRPHRSARRRRGQDPGAGAARRLARRAICSPFSARSSRSPPSAPRPACCASRCSTAPTPSSPCAMSPQTDAQLAFIQPVDAALARLAARRAPRDHPPRLHRPACWPCSPAGSGISPRPPRAARTATPRQGADRGAARLRRLALEPRPRPCALVGADVPAARA